MNALRERILIWRRGVQIEHPNIIGYRQHWTARYADHLGGWGKREAKWLIGTLLAILAMLTR